MYYLSLIVSGVIAGIVSILINPGVSNSQLFIGILAGVLGALFFEYSAKNA